jgi:hypothetical protein
MILEQVTNGIAIRMAVLHLFHGPNGLPADPRGGAKAAEALRP